MDEASRFFLMVFTFFGLGVITSYIAFMALVDKLRKRIKEFENNKLDITDEKIKSIAFEWAVDYKPFNYNLDPSKYAEYGFEKGFKECLKQIEKK